MEYHMIIEELVSTLTCEECGGNFKVEHEMGFDYIPQCCVFCGTEIYVEEEQIDYESV